MSVTNNNNISKMTDFKELRTFKSSSRHSNVSPEDLSERWFISISQAANTLKSTTINLLRSAVLPLSRRYRADRMFRRKLLDGQWSIDTLDGYFIESLAYIITSRLMVQRGKQVRTQHS